MNSSLPWQPKAEPNQTGVYIIAEIGVNHDGDVETAKRLMQSAKTAGADAIKLQIFRAAALAGDDGALCEYQSKALQGATTQQSMLKTLELTSAELRTLRQHADVLDIDFIATPFGIDDVNLLANELNPTAIKIASPDLVNIPLLDAVIQSKLPLVISTGASNQIEIDACINRLQAASAAKRSALLHCVSAYPTPLEQARLGTIRYLAERTGLPIGFSDHTVEIHTGAFAVFAGAVILERHITHDRNAIGPDHAMSTDPDGFREYVNHARRAALARVGGPRACTAIESDVRKLARSRIIAATDIPTGTVLTTQHLRVQRPGTGICPSHWDSIIGQTAIRPIPAGMALDWAHLEPIASAV